MIEDYSPKLQESVSTVTQPVGWFAQFVLDCAASAATVIDPKYVFVGHYEWLKDQEFYQKLPRTKWEIFIGSPTGQGETEKFSGVMHVIAELFYVLPADEPNSLVSLMQMQAALNKAWATNFLPWAKGGNRNPLQIEWGGIKIRRHEKPFVVSTEFKLSTNYIVDQASLPCLVPAVVGN